MKDPLGIKINSIPVLYKLFPNEEACINYLVTFNQNGTPISLFDKTSKVYKLGSTKKLSSSLLHDSA